MAINANIGNLDRMEKYLGNLGKSLAILNIENREKRMESLGLCVIGANRRLILLVDVPYANSSSKVVESKPIRDEWTNSCIINSFLLSVPMLVRCFNDGDNCMIVKLFACIS